MVLDDQFANLDNWNTYYGPGTQWNNKGDLPSGYTGGNQPDSNDECVYSASQDTLMSGGGVSLNDVPSSQFASQGYSESCGVLTSKNTLPSGGWYVQVKRPDARHLRRHVAGPVVPALELGSGIRRLRGRLDGLEPQRVRATPTLPRLASIQEVWSTPGGTNITAGYNTYGFQYIPGHRSRLYFNGPAGLPAHTADLATEAYYLFIELQVASSADLGLAHPCRRARRARPP